MMDEKLRRMNERVRAKNNRQQFRNLIELINTYIYDEKLNTNRCLSMTSSTFQLIKYLEKSSFKKLLDDVQQVNINNQDVLVDVVNIDPVEMQSSQSSLLSKQCSFPIDKFSINLLMDIWNLTGIGFDKTGKILYTSKNFLSRLGLVEPIVGENIKILFHSDADILHKVFVQKVLRWVGYIDVQKPSGKETVSILWNGKMLSDSEGNEMYLGYMEMKDTMYYNPGGIFWNKEVLISADFKLLNRHLYIDLLLGYEEYTSDSFEHLHPMDIIKLKDLNDELQTNGFYESTFRLLCHSTTSEVKWLLVLCKMYPFQLPGGELVLVTYSWPFAFSSDGNFEHDKSLYDNIKFIQNHDAWLSLMPSFYESSSTQMVTANQEESTEMA